MVDFVETHTYKLCVVLRSRVLYGLMRGVPSPYMRETKSEAAEFKEWVSIFARSE